MRKQMWFVGSGPVLYLALLSLVALCVWSAMTVSTPQAAYAQGEEEEGAPPPAAAAPPADGGGGGDSTTSDAASQ